MDNNLCMYFPLRNVLIQRWVNELNDFHLHLYNKPGASNQDADVLSPFPNISKYLIFNVSMETDHPPIDVEVQGVKTKEAWLCSSNTICCMEDQTIEVFNKNNNKIFTIELRKHQEEESKESSVTKSVFHQKTRSKKQTEGLIKRLFREINKLRIDARGIIIKKTSQVNQSILRETLKCLVYQEVMKEWDI